MGVHDSVKVADELGGQLPSCKAACKDASDCRRGGPIGRPELEEETGAGKKWISEEDVLMAP
jgi:hypothetical protein